MCSPWSLLTVSWVLAGCSLFAADVKADEAGVRKVITDFADAWDHHDAEAMAALHTEDVNFIPVSGAWWKTRKEVEENLTRVHREGGGMSRSTMKMRIEQVKFPASNVAVVHGIVELFNALPAETLGENHFIRVVVKEDGKWLISSFQNTHIIPRPTR